MRVDALVVAAGTGSRAGTGGPPKQYVTMAGVPVLARALAIFDHHPAVRHVRAVVRAEHLDLYARCMGGLPHLEQPVIGGNMRQISVLRGLEALADDPPDAVLVHDAARPFLPPAVIDRVIAGLATADAVIAAVAVVDTLKAADAAGRITATVPRQGLAAAQTPQGFRFAPILAAHRAAAAAGRDDFTDDAAVAEWAGLAVHLAEGDAGNIKITTAEDIVAAERRLATDLASLGDVRVGTGYDVHPFAEGDSVTLGGVVVPHDRRLAGHSDADVVLHALTDAILGALGDGDIGVHFPPSDPRWRGAPSRLFLVDAVERVAARGGMVAHLDVAIVAETPRIGPHREAMRAAIAAMAGVGIDRVGVKATTNERLGAIGRGEGIAAIATATIRLPWTRAGEGVEP